MTLQVTVARRKLFNAGWKPSMAGQPVTDVTLHRLLLALNEANRKATMKVLR